MQQKVTTYLFFFFFLFSDSKANNNNYVEGQFFIKIENDCSFIWEKNDEKATQNLENDFPGFYRLLEKNEAFSLKKAFPNLKYQRLSDVYLLEKNKTETSNHKLFIKELERLNYVAYAEKVPLYQAFCTPNDPFLGQQWGMENTNVADMFNVLTNATCDFSSITCNEEIVIAVIDDAVRLTHEDLADNIWQNPNEIPNNNIDDDGNGYVDDINGWDAANNDNNPNPDLSIASNSCFTHGTHVAGIVAATTDNSIGIASVGFRSKIMAVKIKSDGSCGGGLDGAYSGVEYALASQPHIMSMSWGGGGFSQTYQDMFLLANDLGITCIAAAGNDASAIPMYPASYDGVISVGATNDDDEITYFSNFGATIDIMAPGQDILSTLAGADDAYGEFNGTSMACPFVSSVVGLMLCFDATLSPQDVENCLDDTAINIDAQNPDFVGQMGSGLIDVGEIINCLQVPPISAFSIDFDIYCVGETIDLTAESSGPQITAYDWAFENGTPASFNGQNASVSFATAGTYDITLTTTNPYGNHSITKQVTIGTPTATLSGTTTIIANTTASLGINYDGSLPFNLVYSDGENEYTIEDIENVPYFFNVTPSDTTTYSLVSVSNDFCEADINGTATVTTLHIGEDEMCEYASIYGTNEDNGFGYVPFYDTENEILYRTGSNPRLCSFDARTGEVIWSKNYNSGLGFGNISKNNSGMLTFVANTAWSSNSDWVINRTDTLGNILWSKQYVTSGRQVSGRIIESNNDTHIITGWYNANGGSSDDIGLLKVDNDGNVLAGKSISLGGDDQMGEVFSDGNGGLYIAGEIEHDKTVFLFHIDADLNILQQKQWQPQLNYYTSSYFSLIQTADNGFVILAWRSGGSETDEYAAVLRIDNNWNMQWVRAIYPANNNDIYARPVNVNEDSAGNIYVNTVSKTNNNTLRTCYTKFDANGNEIWTKLMQNPTTFEPLAVPNVYVAMEYNPNTPNYEFILGAKISGGVFGGDDFVLIRTNTNFDACSFAETDFTIENETWNELNLNYTTGNISFNPTNLSQTATDYPLSKETPCIECEISEECNFECDFTASQMTICEGESIDFEAACNDAVLYIWHINDSLFAETPDTSYFFTETGTYSIKLYTSDGDCVAVSEQTITVGAANATADEDMTICKGETANLNASGGLTYNWSPSGNLNDATIANPISSTDTSTLYTVLITDANGCNTTDSLMLWVVPPPVLIPATLDTTICFGDTLVTQLTDFTPISNYEYSWSPTTGLSCTDCPNPIATVTETTIYTLTLTNALGCNNMQDFTINILTLEDLSHQTDTVLCSGANFILPNGLEIIETGIYYDTLTSVSNCNSLLIFNVTFNENATNETAETLCLGEIFILPNGVEITETGIYFDTLTTVTNCDSLLVFDILFQENISNTISESLCNGDTFTLPNGLEVFETGIYYDTLITNANCDSILVFDILFSEFLIDTLAFANCSNDILILPNGLEVSETGVYYDTLTTNTTCDSLFVFDVSFGENSNIEINENLCLEDIYVLPNGLEIFETGLYYDTLTNNSNCDSLLTFNLNFEDCTEIEDLPCTMLLPTAFSPNDDGVNDEFGLICNCKIKESSLLVYNRWGEKIFESADSNISWNGFYKNGACEIGVYVFHVAYIMIDNETGEEIIETQKGNLTLVK
ncbi:MAG: S8 family serine peptidase [Chitinophagales bacterium]